MQVSYYLDFIKLDLIKQKELISKLSLDNGFILRDIKGTNFLNYPHLNNQEFTNLEAINLGAYIFSFNNNEGSIINLVNNLLLKTNKLIININLKQSLHNIEEYLLNLRSLFPKAIFYLNPLNSFNGVIIKQVLDHTKVKNVYLYLGLKELFRQNISYLFQYRLLKQYIKMISFTDYDKKEVPTLLGYGRFELLSFFKLLIDDHYDGQVILDSDVFLIVKLYDKEYLSASDRLKRIKYSKHYKELKKIVSNNGLLTIKDILLNQVSVLKKIFAKI